jgi:hypothetical protein
MACDDTCFYVHVQQHEEGASQRSVSAEVWTVKVTVCVLYVCPPRSTRQSGEVVARVQTQGSHVKRQDQSVGKFAFGDRTLPIHARTLGSDVHPQRMDVYYGTVRSAVVHTN